MNLNIRESDILTWEVFPGKGADAADWFLAYFVSVLFHLVVFGVAQLCLFVGPLFLPTELIWLTLPLTLLSFILLPHAGKLHKGYGLRSYYTGNGPLDYAQKYWALSKADRTLFPPNIIETLKNPHLTDVQERQVLAEMSKVFESISKRDAALAAAKSKEIDVSGVLDTMARNRESLDIETNTYRELL